MLTVYLSQNNEPRQKHASHVPPAHSYRKIKRTEHKLKMYIRNPIVATNTADGSSN